MSQWTRAAIHISSARLVPLFYSPQLKHSLMPAAATAFVAGDPFSRASAVQSSPSHCAIYTFLPSLLIIILLAAAARIWQLRKGRLWLNRQTVSLIQPLVRHVAAFNAALDGRSGEGWGRRKGGKERDG